MLSKTIGVDKFHEFALAVDPNYELTWFHREIAYALQQAYDKVERGEKARIILEVPPRHGKSELATIKFPAWSLGKSPHIPIIVSSYSQGLAEDFGLKTRDLMQNDVYKTIFKTRLRQDSTAKGKWLTADGGGYTATGVGGSITGRGFKIGIIDDPIKNREEAESLLHRDKIWDWYTSTFYTRQEGYGAIIVICTRWHLDDLVGRLEKQEEDARARGEENYDAWEFITFPAIAVKEEAHRNIGSALWPEKFNESALDNIKNAIGQYDFSSLYQQSPIPAEHQVFDPARFGHYQPSDIKFRTLETFTLIDPAISDATDADEWVVLTIGKERTSPNIYRLEESCGRGDPDKFLQAIFYHQDQYKSKVWLETKAFQKILKRDIREDQKKNAQYFTVHELKSAKNNTKIGRIKALIPLYEAGVIFHRMDDQGYERQLLEFPYGRHDDRIDAMSFLNEALFEKPTDYSGAMLPRRKVNADPYA